MAALAPLSPDRDPVRGKRWSTVRLLECAAVGLFLTLATVRFVIAPLDRYDEGVVLTKAMLLLAGRVPFRDYWATYGPLDTIILAAAFKVFGISILVERLLGALTVAAFGVIAYLMLGIVRLRRGMRLLLTGLIAMVPLAVPAFNTAFLANVFGLIAVLGFLRGLQRPALHWPVLAGAMIGLASFSRPEYALAVGAAMLCGYGLMAWRSLDRRHSRNALGLFLGASILVTATLWLPVVLLAGINPVRLDLLTYSLQIYPRARSIPFGAGPEAVVVITFSIAFAAVWLWAAVQAFRHRLETVTCARLLTLLLASIAVFTWVRTRADGIHAFDAWPLTAVLLAVLLGTRLRPTVPRMDAIAGIAGILLLSVGAAGLAFRDVVQPHDDAGIRSAGISGERAWMPPHQLAQLIQLIDATVAPGRPIWVGLERNDLITFNDTMLYFLSNRPPATVYYEALPGLTNSEPVERLIACQLVSSDVGLIVLGPNAAGEPWNLSSVPGSTYLDQWIGQHAAQRSTLGPYQLIRLMPGLSADAACPSSAHGELARGSQAVPGTSRANAGWGAPDSAAS